MKVLVIGAGNIGTTLVNLLAHFKEVLNISEIHLMKNRPFHWLENDLQILKNKGVYVHYYSEGQTLFEILKGVDYVFDTTANGIGNDNKANWYLDAPHIQGFSAQGSEKGFGKPFMTGINNSTILHEKFVQIVSCNTHATLSILNHISRGDLSSIDSADFVVVRRSEDLGNHSRLVSSNVVARHLDRSIGTHHAIDALDLLNTIGMKINLTSSDITTPSQLMHSVRFRIQLNKPTSENEILQYLEYSPFVGITSKFDSNTIFEMGRRYGFQGRIYEHVIFIENNMMFHSGNIIFGWAFVPQEGNTLLSTLHAYLLQTNAENSEKIISSIAHEMLIRKF